MRVAVIHVAAGETRKLASLSEILAEGFRRRGYEAEVLAAERGEAPRLGLYDYVVLGTEPEGLGGKLPPRVATLLAQCSSVPGLRGMAVVRRRGLFSGKALARLMKAMEGQGISVNYSAGVGNGGEAELAAREAPAERPL